MARKHGKFTNHKKQVVSVRNEPKLAEFLDSLSNASGELEEELVCTVDGGVGGIEDGQVFEAGTKIEDVLIALLSGTPSLAISGFKLYNASGDLIATGQANAYAAGVEITLDDIAFTIDDSAGVIGSNTGTLQFSDAALNETGITVTNGANTYDTTANQTFGKTTSTIPHAYNYAYKTQQISFQVPTDSGTTLTSSATLYHALPCFMINVNENTMDLATFTTLLGVDPGVAAATFSPAVVSTVTKVDAQADYTGIDWVNAEANWVGQTVRHYWFVPAVAGASPTTIGYTVGGTSATGDITQIGAYNLNMSSTGFNLIDDAGATSVAYRIWYWANTNAITSATQPIAFT